MGRAARRAPAGDAIIKELRERTRGESMSPKVICIRPSIDPSMPCFSEQLRDRSRPATPRLRADPQALDGAASHESEWRTFVRTLTPSSAGRRERARPLPGASRPRAADQTRSPRAAALRPVTIFARRGGDRRHRGRRSGRRARGGLPLRAAALVARLFANAVATTSMRIALVFAATACTCYAVAGVLFVLTAPSWLRDFPQGAPSMLALQVAAIALLVTGVRVLRFRRELLIYELRALRCQRRRHRECRCRPRRRRRASVGADPTAPAP